MIWTKRLAVTLSLALSGCAAQDTILPPAEQTMLEIYRGAMTTPGAQPSRWEYMTAVCEELALDTALQSVEDCKVRVREHIASRPMAVDAGPAVESLDYLPYTRDVVQEIDNLFPRLANPDIVIYVYPHLATRTQAPIPGYSTVIPLYEHVHYRLPGESQRSTPVLSATASTGEADNAMPRKPTGPSDTTHKHYHKSSHLESSHPAPATAFAPLREDEG